MDRHLLDLPPEILDMIISYLEYASEVNNLAQTCRRVSYSANARLYSYWAKKQSPPDGIVRIVTNENVDSLRKLISCGLNHQEYSDGNHQKYLDTDKSWTPLRLACVRGSTTVVRALLEIYGSQAIVASARYYGDNLLHIAARYGHLDIIKLLVEEGISTEGERDALAFVINFAPSPTLPIIKYMVNEGGFPVDKKQPRITPLGVAALVGKWDVFKFLVEVGAWSSPVTDLRTCFSCTAPIFCAAELDNKEMLQFLLDRPARLALDGEPDADDAADLAVSGRDAIEAIVRDQTALARDAQRDPSVSPTAMDQLYQYAASSGDTALVQRLLDTGWDFNVLGDHSPLNLAAQNGHTEVIKLFLDSIKGIPELLEMVDWFPVLIKTAIENDDESIVEVAIEYGGKTMMSTCAATALECSLRHGRKSITALLLKHGALEEVENAQDISMEDSGMMHILEAAYSNGDYSLVENLLTRNGLSIFDDLAENFTGWDCWDSEHGSNAVAAAAYYGPLEGFQRILNLGAVTLNPEEAWCHDAFRCAVYGVQPNIIRLFLESGYNVASGRSLLTEVLHSTSFVDERSDEVLTTIRLLLDAGAELEAKDSEHRTPLSIATLFCVRTRCKEDKSFPIIQELLARGADPLIGFEAGKSALQMAMKTHNKEVLQILVGVVEAKGYVLGLEPYKGEMGDTPTGKDKSGHCDLELEKWKKFAVTKVLRQHFWRMVYPVRKKGEDRPVSAIVFPGD